MTPIVLIIVCGVLPLVGFAVGAAVGKANATPREDRQELDERRTFMNDLIGEAAEHVALGDPFAAIVLDKHREFHHSRIARRNNQ